MKIPSPQVKTARYWPADCVERPADQMTYFAKTIFLTATKWLDSKRQK
jgi:hypothetical protein